MVSQTLEASPSSLCKREAKQRKEKGTDNKRKETAEDTIFPRVSAIPSPGSQVRYTEKYEAQKGVIILRLRYSTWSLLTKSTYRLYIYTHILGLHSS